MADGYIYLDYYDNKQRNGQKRLYLLDAFKFKARDFVRVKSSFKDQTDWFGIIVGCINIFDGAIGVIADWSMDRAKALSANCNVDFDRYVMQGYNLVDKRWFEDPDFSWSNGALPTLGYMDLNEKMTKEDTQMHQAIVEAFPKTKDAVMIDKWFGKQFEQNALIALLVKGKEKTLIEEALRLEENSKNSTQK